MSSVLPSGCAAPSFALCSGLQGVTFRWNALVEETSGHHSLGEAQSGRSSVPAGEPTPSSAEAAADTRAVVEVSTAAEVAAEIAAKGDPSIPEILMIVRQRAS